MHAFKKSRSIGKSIARVTLAIGLAATAATIGYTAFTFREAVDLDRKTSAATSERKETANLVERLNGRIYSHWETLTEDAYDNKEKNYPLTPDQYCAEPRQDSELAM